jgi:hypothetical protein
MDYYPSMVMLQVDLFTKGEPIVEETGATTAKINTAVDDLTAFLNYVGSNFVKDWCDTHDITLIPSVVRNLTGIVDDTSWEYRAMTELEVRFTQTAVGYAGLMFDGGMPFYSNGNPKYDNEGYALDRQGNRLKDESGEPLPPLPIDPETGRPIFPPIEPSPSGGGSQSLANHSAGWFNQAEINEEVFPK